MTAALLILSCALANRLWGWGGYPLPRATAMLAPALSVGIPAAFTEIMHTNSAYRAALLAAVIYIGLVVWRSPGTGKTFNIIHAREMDRERAFVVCLVRGGVWSIPLFCGLYFVTGAQYAPALSLLAGLSWALCYGISGLMGEKYAVERAELVNGAVMGGLLWVTM